MMAPRSSGPLRVVGRYALYAEIAAGGMATVHIGRLLGPVGFARTVAIKRLHPQYAKDPEFASMFLDEARLAARVQHPNVVATIDVVATDGELFLIMDYVRGESLSRLVRTSKKRGELVPPRIVASIICGFLHGLHAAHEAKDERGEPLNLVHRDVSPQNVLVGSDGIARVLDFGIAKAAGRVQVTKDGQIKGKLAYMPPEQLAGRPLNRTVDVYASAVVMWEALVGERLFKGDNEGETLAKILRDEVPAPSQVEPRVPHEFDAPLLRALSRDPTKRHATARELALELERCAGMASPTEVGEWVERMAGQVLAAREGQVAEIESASASMRLPPEPDSESDISNAFPQQVTAIFGDGGTERMASPVSSGPFAPLALPPESLGTPQSDGTGSRVTGTMALPVSKKGPMILAIVGLALLLGVVGLVIALKDDSTGAPVAPAPSASVEPVADTTPSAAASASATPTESATAAASAPEAPSASASAAAEASASATATASASSTASATPPVKATSTPTSHHAWTPPTPPKPPTPTGKKNCDPPYTVDSSGHKKYKLECM
jgi:serine/threonine protein kinase